MSKYTEDDIINYVSGLKVSDDFLKELETNTILQKEVTSLKSDLYIMENVEDSNLFLESKKKSIIKIKNGIVDYLLYFSKTSPLASRGENSNKVNEVYLYDNIEVYKNSDEYYLIIKDIKNYCIIEHNSEKIVNILGSKSEYSLSLEKGLYNVKADNLETEINIE